MSTMNPPAEPKIVSRDEWQRARVALLQEEKDLTRRRDAVARRRRELPWVRVDKNYVFDTPHGPRSLGELFAGRSQLLVKHFMLGPGWQEGCVGCSFEVDHIESALVHVQNHDVKVVAIARAPLPEIEAFKRRMGWRIDWVSSLRSDFNFDFHVSFTPEQVAAGKAFYNYREEAVPSEELSAISVFARDGAGNVCHTYTAYGRGAEELISSYMLLDLTPKGRNEPDGGNLTSWVRHHDRYGAGGHVDATGRYVPPEGGPCCGGKP